MSSSLHNEEEDDDEDKEKKQPTEKKPTDPVMAPKTCRFLSIILVECAQNFMKSATSRGLLVILSMMVHLLMTNLLVYMASE